MPGSDIERAAVIVEGILDKLAKTPMKLDADDSYHRQCRLDRSGRRGVGGAAYIACDEALYDAKTSGRNRFVINNRKPHRGSARMQANVDGKVIRKPVVN